MYFVLHSTVYCITFEVSNKAKEQFFRTTVESKY
jgi:hypothetical protein